MVEFDDSKRIWKKEMLRGKEIDVAYYPGTPGKCKEEVEELQARGERVHVFNFCPKLNPRTYEAEPGIICEQDVPVKLRDGVTIYCDIYRPDTTEKVPVLVSWSPFGKRQSEGMADWKLMGVPPQTVSRMAKFESADPGFWCRQGYAVANVDPRGVGNSEGNVNSFGDQDGQDEFDFTEWVAVQLWCSGKVAFCGNSGVAMSNWRVAAAQPPHLACIAPWEGTGDMYRESLCVGGIPSAKFNDSLNAGIACKTYVEDNTEMLRRHPLYDDYWASKTPQWEKIKVPVYVCAGLCHFHLRGSIEGFRRIRSPKKWLRIHREFEWPDTYNPENLLDLKRFFDRYLKDVRNGWEFTPRVRVDVMDGYAFDFASKRPEKEFPLKRTQYKKIWLDAASHGGELAECQPFAAESEVTYDPLTDMTVFDYKFQEDTEITGYMKLRLWVECRGHDEMDLFVWIKKLGLDGEYLPIHCMDEAFRGAWGYLRVSHRALDEKLATDFQPVAGHQSEQKLSPGEIVPVDIEIWPHSRFWHKGESIRVEIEGRYIRTEWYEDAKMGFEPDNGGIHVIHTGGKYDSYLQIPTIPPKYQVGDYVVR